MTDNNKIPIGKYKHIRALGGNYYDYVIIKFKKGIIKDIKDGDIITLDMIEPYESIAVRKVADYINENLCPEVMPDRGWFIDHAKEIVVLVHEAEDADE